MSYLTISHIVDDQSIMRRALACCATEGVENPRTWVIENDWELAAQPNWAAAYASAKLAHDADPENVPPPGENEAAITDGMILSGVQALLARTTPDGPGEAM